jgi:hypothetical protein
MAESAGDVPALDIGDADGFSRQVLSKVARRRALRLAMEDGHPGRACHPRNQAVDGNPEPRPPHPG